MVNIRIQVFKTFIENLTETYKTSSGKQSINTDKLCTVILKAIIKTHNKVIGSYLKIVEKLY